MAKRAVRREKRKSPTGQHGRAPVAPAAPPASTPVWRTSAFWIGGAVVGLLVAVLAGAVVIATGGDEESATPTSAEESQIQSPEELEKQFAERDREQIESLTAQAREISDGLAPTMAAFNRALRDGDAPPPASGQWLSQTRRHAATFRESVSGETATNVARLGLRASLEGLVNAIDLYRLGGDAPNRRAIVARAREQRDIAVRTWSAATIQIDAINIEAGFGHQHVPQLAGAATGALPPDTLPEGTDATGDG
jgi:hypothetical protein